MLACLSFSGTDSKSAIAVLQQFSTTGANRPAVALRFTAQDLIQLDSQQQLAILHESKSQGVAVRCGAVELVCPDEEEQLLEATIKAIQAAIAANAKHVVIEFASPLVESISIECLDQINELALQEDVELSVDVAASRDVMRRRIEDIVRLPDRRLGIAVDTGNYLIANPTSSVEVMLQRNLQHLDAILLRDAPAEVSGGGQGDRLPLGGDGLIDYARIYQIIRDVTFAGPCIFDLSPNLGGSSDGTDGAAHSHVADAAKHLQICGWLPKAR